jgi:hypothetical protein
MSAVVFATSVDLLAVSTHHHYHHHHHFHHHHHHRHPKTHHHYHHLPPPPPPPTPPQHDEEISFKEGDAICLTSRVDDEWLEGYLYLDATKKVGIFPTAFVEIIVDLDENAEAIEE